VKLFKCLLILMVLALTGCGYHHPAFRQNKTGDLAIFAGAWANRTNEMALEGMLMQKMADWLQQSSKLRLESDPDQADYLLSGTIEAVNYPATAFDSSDRATTQRAWVKVTYSLRDHATGQLLWEINDVARERNFQTGKDALLQRSNKEEALAFIADELAEMIYLNLLTSLTPSPAGDAADR
jgi:outer membrane lipopolysaccharide assembly protein LptE/RlpB